MELNNCLICLCHKDNKKYNKCKGKKHIYKIPQKKAESYNFSIRYIKEEMKDGRHLGACLGSVGLTFLSDIEIFENYCFNFDRDFYKILKTYNN